jgi:hypothetical protein
MSSAAEWIAITRQPMKRKRAELACEQCHLKKTKCDLLARTAQRFSKCSNCESAGRECQRRASQRANSGRRPTKTAKVTDGTEGVGSADGSVGSGHTHTFAQRLEPALVPDTTSDYPTLPTPPAFDVAVQQALGVPQSGLGSQALQHHNTTPRHSNGSPGTRMGGSRVEQGDHHPDSGFQYVYGPENSLDAQDQEQSSTKPPQRLEELPDPGLQQSFLETYFDYCYPWCPVIDRSTAGLELLSSPMLANAIALAGSHLRPPIIAHTQPDVYYDRARKMFYSDEEADNLMALKSLCLFYWWSPRPPTTVHRQ